MRPARMSKGSEEYPCHITDYAHGPHEWTPLVVDPDDDHVLHLFGQTVRCPGVPRREEEE